MWVESINRIKKQCTTHQKILLIKKLKFYTCFHFNIKSFHLIYKETRKEQKIRKR